MPSLRNTAILLVLGGSAAVQAAAPYPLAQSSFNANQESLINNDVQSFLATQTGGSAFAAASEALATATGAGAEDLLREFRGDPNGLANEFFTASATPTWFNSALPTAVRAYVTLVAAEQASILTRDALSTNLPDPATMTTSAVGTAGPTGSDRSGGDGKSGAEGRRAGVVGAVVAAGVVGVALI